MGIIQDNLHPIVLKNQLFIRAVDYLITKYGLEGQKAVSQLTKIGEAALSNIRNDKKVVSDKTIRKLMDAFPGVFNPDYFRGESLLMTVEEVMQEKMDSIKQEPQQPTMTTFDTSVLIEKAVEKATAYADKTIVALEGQLADKNKYIKMLERRVAELEAAQQFTDAQDVINNHPFPIGVADKRDEQPSTHV